MADYLNTIRRIPPDIRLAMATREFDMWEGPSCLCGWAIRERLHKTLPRETTLDSPELADGDDWLRTADLCQAAFGGTGQEWTVLYLGVMGAESLLAIELAFVQALDEAVSGSA